MHLRLGVAHIIILASFLFIKRRALAIIKLSSYRHLQVLLTINQSQTDQVAGQVVLLSGLDQGGQGFEPHMMHLFFFVFCFLAFFC